MSSEKFLTPSAVIVMLFKEVNGKKFVLCQRRKNTVFGEGMFDLSFSGKVEKDESMLAAALREGEEELKLKLKKDDLKFVCLIHKNDNGIIYYNAYFSCENFNGEPTVGEPEKCSELRWFPVDELPSDLLDDRRVALEAREKNTAYVEYGWD